MAELNTILDYALFYLSKGLSVIPLKPRDKKPIVKWKEFQQRKPTEEEVRKWFEGKTPEDVGIAIVCGRVSGNLIVIDFDDFEKYQEFEQKVAKSGLKGLINTWIVRTGKGVHIYYRLTDDAFQKFGRTRVRFVEGVDIKGEGGYVVAPPSIHPSGKQYFFPIPPTDVDIKILNFGELESILRLIAEEYKIGDTIYLGESVAPSDELKELEKVAGEGEGEKKKTENIKFRTLDATTKLKIKELLWKAYKPGYRQTLLLYLAGWLAHARISFKDAAELLWMFVDSDESENKDVRKWLDALCYSYGKVYGDKFVKEELKKLWPTITSWLAKYNVPPPEQLFNRNFETGEEVAGRGGLLKLLTDQGFSEEEATDIITRLQELLQSASPFKDLLAIIYDYDKQKYIIINYRKKFVVDGRRTEKGFKFGPTVFDGAPRSITVYIDPLGGYEKFDVVWEFENRPPLKIVNAALPDILARLRLASAISYRAKAEDFLSRIIQWFIRTGRAEVKTEISAPGFYLINGELKAVKVNWLGEPSDDEVREALEFLNYLAENWYAHCIEKFATVIKWAVVAPFNFVYKQRGQFIPWLYLFGVSKTGKTRLGYIALSIWGLELTTKNVKSGASIDTVPRFGAVASESTFPVLINEPGGALEKEEVREAIKNAIDSTVARGKYLHGGYVDIPSLRPFIFASNKVLPTDDALLRRLVVITFTFRERIPDDLANEFQTQIEPQFKKLKPIGAAVAKMVLENPSLLDMDWRKLAEKILTDLYQRYLGEVPEWVSLWHEERFDVYENVRELIREFMLSAILDAYSKHVGRDDSDVESKIRYVLNQGLIPWLILRRDGKVVVTTGIIRVIGKQLGTVNTLKSLAELLGWDYKVVKLGKRPVRAAVTTLEEFIEFLLPNPDTETENEEAEEVA